MTAVITVDYLETFRLVRAGPNYQWLISTGPLYVANQLGKIDSALLVRIVRMSDEFVHRD
jgi:hypothetical protein